MFATDSHDVLCSMAQIDLTGLVPCSHEEADTRLFLHVADAIKKGYRKLLVRTVDTDVVVMVAIATLKRTKPGELWVAFGTGGHFRFIPIHEVAAAVGPRISATLPLFHALTGCDTVSSFAGIGKKTSWAAWNVKGKGKGSFYIAQYPVRWTAQSALHFCPPCQTCSFRHQLGFSGKHSSDAALRAKTKSLTCPPLSIARYSFIQLSQLGRQCKERKFPIFETVAKEDSLPAFYR